MVAYRHSRKPTAGQTMSESYVVAISTASSKEEAHKLAAALVGEKKAACVQMMPIDSCYFWEGKVNNDPEILLLIKARKSHSKDIKRIIMANHSYKVPEIIFLDVTDGSSDYFNWISSVTQD